MALMIIACLPSEGSGKQYTLIVKVWNADAGHLEPASLSLRIFLQHSTLSQLKPIQHLLTDCFRRSQRGLPHQKEAYGHSAERSCEHSQTSRYQSSPEERTMSSRESHPPVH